MNRKIYGRRPSCLSNIPGHTVWYRKCSSGVPNELRGVPNGLKDGIGTGSVLLVYQQGQDVWFWLGEENCGRKVGDIPDSRSSTLGVTLSVQIQITIILGEKGVVRPPERHPRLDSGEKSHFLHPMHKPGIFRHTLSYYMTTMEIRSFTYRFLCRNINNSQLFKYQCYKRNVGQLLYGFQNKC